jgi:heme-degrading monooxygenase HmoA
LAIQEDKMFVVISHHWCKPNRKEEAQTRIDQSGGTMESAPGFVFRYRMEPPSDPTQVSTMTVWTNEESYRSYRAARTAPSPADDSVPYACVTTEVYETHRVHGQPGR